MTTYIYYYTLFIRNDMCDQKSMTKFKQKKTQSSIVYEILNR